ncbi:MAG: trypsin-like peptidase domain-containing protein [Chloroflexi bacterium]|nr:trypsin-like peptidase domain-containing protein [Chloroflexota bacterium]
MAKLATNFLVLIALSLVINSVALAAMGGCAQKAAVTPTPGGGVAPPAPTTTTTPTAPTTPRAALDSLPSFSDVAARVTPAVVSIFTVQVPPSFFLQPTPQEGAGSGVIFDSKGYILTNNHVVEGATQLTVNLPDGRVFKGVKVIGRDPVTDLAVVKIEGQNLPSLPLGDSDKLRVGDWVVAVGNALALEGGPTLTVGVVSALGRSIQVPGEILHDLIQTDAPINPGNSGGPLVNLQGQVVGINTAIDVRGTGIGFAVSMTTAQPVVQQLMTTGRVVWPWIGVGVGPVTPALASELKLKVDKGVYVASVTRASPAAQAGLRQGDVIIRFESQEVATVRQLQEAIRRQKIGDRTRITFIRDGQEQTVTVTLEEMPRGL